ncbi:hypothetical protein JL721_4489 [Aureococcus anophagefferens]|nr:hypothetical protein JL721_4489 [Aureococcus anophagefferens]
MVKNLNSCCRTQQAGLKRSNASGLPVGAGVAHRAGRVAAAAGPRAPRAGGMECVFKIKLKRQFEARLCVVGCFDGHQSPGLRDAAARPLVIVGGNCSVLGFDWRGAEEFWTAHDYEIRVFQHEEAVTEATEADWSSRSRASTAGASLVWATAPSGAYRALERKWRVKSKHALVALAAHDVTGDGACEIIAGWSTGALTVPRATGRHLPRRLRVRRAVLWADLRMSGAPQVVGVSVDGELRGYVAVDATQVGRDDEERAAREQLGALQARKRELLLELRSLEDTIRHASGDGGANAGTLVVGAHDAAGAPRFFPRKNFPANLKIQIHVGSRPSSKELHVFEVDYELPKFCCFLRVEDPRHAPQPTSYVQFSLPVTLPPLAEWIEKSFVNMEAVKFTGDSIQVYYVSIRRLPRGRAGAGAPRLAATVTLARPSPSGSRRARRELESVADFPAEMTALEDILSRVAKFNAIRIRLTADMADGSARIKALVLKAEDARLMADMPLMKRHYAELFALNNELIAEYNKRANNHEALLAALKDVNQIIQKASNLRAGAAKSRVVAEARAAIKTNAIDSLYQIVSEGRSKVSLAQ